MPTLPVGPVCVPPTVYKEYKELYKSKDRNATSSTSALLTFPSELISSLHEISPSFDNEAGEFLWADCRTRAHDCTAEEVLHFVSAKAALLNTGRIQNPIGFLLAAVPKCFEGESFQVFRKQQARRREEQRRREEEERKNAEILEKEMHLEQETYRQAEERLASLPAEEYQALYERNRSEFLTKVPKARSWAPEALDQSIRARMIRDLQSELLTRNHDS